MRKKQILILIIILTAHGLFGGDVAKFVNLGFSTDNHYFMFAQYGIKEKNSGSYADLYIVDVAKNQFAPFGEKSLSYNDSPEPGTDGMAALFNILEQNIALKVKYNIDHLKTGRILYFFIKGDEVKEQIKFRDFNTGHNYAVELRQETIGKGKTVSASFHIKFSQSTSSGTSQNHNVGLPDFKRKGVKNYKIRQIILGPDEKSLIFVIEKEEINNEGSNFRYMIETLEMK